ncbi:hypothetical protein JCM5296_001819, partial [Sporobolomyces johnsonii]
MPATQRCRPALVALACFVLVVLVVLLRPHVPRGFAAYATRPLWDTPEAPKDVIPHLWADGLGPEQLCALHSWDTRTRGDPLVWDATIFSTEIDLLLIRLHELDPSVDRFFILASDRTFTGLPKPVLLPDALETPPFARFRHKIVYRTFNGSELQPGDSPWQQEIQLRQAMTTLLKEHFPPTPSSPPIMLFSDVDEIPSRKTVELLKACDFGSPLHLGLRSFVYSFEWEEGGEASSWRPTAVQWPLRGQGEDEFYRHGKVTERVLADSGWHCSWCFRHLSEFVTKATGYSHVDRLGSRPSALLRPSRIQRTICDGLDMFEMLPEAYTYRDLFTKMRLMP